MNSENHPNNFSESPIEQFEANTPQSRRCEEIIPAIAAHSIGATDPEEAARINARLADCPQATADLASFSQMATQMLYSAPAIKAPQQIAHRLRAATATSTVPNATSVAKPRPALLRRTKVGLTQTTRPLPSLPSAMAHFRLESTQHPTIDILPMNQGKGATAAKPKSWNFGYVLAAVSIIALLLLNVVLLLQNQQLINQHQGLSQTLIQQNQALILLSAEDPQEVEIFDPDGISSAQADILWNNSLGIAVVYVRNFPQCESDMKYQLWLMKNGQRSSGGLFSVDASGMGLLVMPLEASLDTYDAIGITPEPATGSLGPTSPPVVRGDL